MLAESESWPEWVPGDEFRAIREEDCAPGRRLLNA